MKNQTKAVLLVSLVVGALMLTIALCVSIYVNERKYRASLPYNPPEMDKAREQNRR